jgi:hypothetical protein
MRERSGLVIVQRDEGLLLKLNVEYHLALGMSQIIIIDNASEDVLTAELLQELSLIPHVTVIFDKSPECDQAALANMGLNALLDDPEIQWVFPCDADEFIWFNDDLEAWLSKRREQQVLYGTLAWLNHIPESPPQLPDKLAHMYGSLFYSPFPERPWQRRSHFRKAFCHRHSGMEIVVGGHFFRRETDSAFFGSLKHCPTEMPDNEGIILHYEMRDCGPSFLRKCDNLVKRHRASGVAPDGPWREKEVMLGVLCDYYGTGPERIFSEFALGRRTLWGTEIPTDRLQRR